MSDKGDSSKNQAPFGGEKSLQLLIFKGKPAIGFGEPSIAAERDGGFCALPSVTG
jgi:hypothetical protein